MAGPTESAVPTVRPRSWLRTALVAALLVVAAIGGGGLWLTMTSGGLNTALGALAWFSGGRLEFGLARGSLTQGLQLQSVRVQTDSQRWQLEGLVIDGSLLQLWQGNLTLARVHADALELAFRPQPGPTLLPDSLALPVALHIELLDVGEVRLRAWQDDAAAAAPQWFAVKGLQFGIDADAQRYKVTRLQVLTPAGPLEGSASLAVSAPFALELQAGLHGEKAGQPYRIDAGGRGTLSALQLNARAEGWKLSGSASSELRLLSPLPVRQVSVQIEGLDPAALIAGAPSASLSLQAQLTPLAAADGSLPASLDDWTLAGPLQVSNLTPGALDQQRLPVGRLRADARWHAGVLDLSALTMTTGRDAGSRVTGSARWTGGTLALALTAPQLDPHDLWSGIKTTRLGGQLSASLSSEVQSVALKARELVAHWGPSPWQASLEARRRDGRVEVSAARLGDGHAWLELQGHVDLQGPRSFAVKGQLRRFDPSRLLQLPSATLSGDLSATGALQPSVRGELQFALRDSQLQTAGGLRALKGHGQISVRDGHLVQTNVALDLAGNQFNAQGAWGRAGDRLQYMVDAPQLATLGWGLTGRLSAHGSLSGTLAAPSGDIQAEGAQLGRTGGVLLDSLSLDAQLLEGADGRFEASLSAGPLRRAAGTAVLLDSISAKLVGSRRAHRLQASALWPANRIDAVASGGLGAAGQWQGQLEQMDWRGDRGAMTLAAPVALTVSRQQVRLGAAELRSSVARLNLVQTEWTPQGWISRGSLQGLRLALSPGLPSPETAIAGPALILGGQWDLHGSDHLDGTLQLRRESGDLVLPGEAALGLGLTALSLDLQIRQDRVEARAAVAGERLGQISANGQFGLEPMGVLWRPARQQAMQLQAQLDLPSLAWVGPLIDTNVQLSGHAHGALQVAGTPEQPRASGSLQLADLSLALVAQGLRLSQGDVVVDFTEDRARLRNFSMRSSVRVRPREARADPTLLGAEGRLSGSGEIRLSDGVGVIELKAEHLAVLQRVDRWLMLSGDLRVATAWDALVATGSLRADAGYFEFAAAGAPSLSDDVVVLGRQPSSTRNLRLSADISADLGEHAYLKGRGLDARLGGSLRLRVDGRSPLRITGSIATRDGSYDAYGQSLSIERGIVNFQGAPESAGLNVLALRKGLPVEAGVEISGSVRHPRVKLVSEPSVPDVEKLSWIVTGHALDQTGGANSALLMAAAGAILGGESGGLSQQLAQGLGLDQLSLGSADLSAGSSLLPSATVAGSTLGNRDASLTSQIVTLGKRLSTDVYLSYEQSLSGAANVVKLTYQLSRRLSLVGRAGTDNAVDLNYSFSFN